MNKVTLFFIMACIFYLKGYAQQTEVLTLGVFLRHTLPENINFRKVKCNSLVSG